MSTKTKATKPALQDQATVKKAKLDTSVTKPTKKTQESTDSDNTSEDDAPVIDTKVTKQ